MSIHHYALTPEEKRHMAIRGLISMPVALTKEEVKSLREQGLIKKIAKPMPGWMVEKTIRDRRYKDKLQRLSKCLK